ncbi:outer membrane protein [Legionella sp. W05-934-2]|jgi:opacity protein-like surface antigen|uniref:outer membrane protein n=1 Tax=Legionella sp. W05-934-2 TaxID=1198649 RepID=UPI003461D7A4
MIRKLVTSSILSLLFASSTQAGCLACDDGLIGPNDEFPIVWTKVITVSGGPGWTKAGDTQMQYSTSTPIPLFNNYIANKKWNTLGEGELYFALQHILTNYMTGRFGIAAAGSSQAKLQGTVIPSPSATVQPYTYSYRITHGRVGLKGMLLFGAQNQTFMPYIMGSFGLGMNSSHQYKETQIPQMPTFRSNTTTAAFAYTLGGGLEAAFNQNWHGGIGYQFADWGKSNLDSIGGQPYDEGLRLARLYTHVLQFSLTYICS